MSDKHQYQPAATSEPTEPPPTYESAAAQHGIAVPKKSPSTANGKSPLPRGPFPLDIPVLNHLRGKRIILASASPRRKQLLAQIGLTNLEILPSTKPENLPKSELGPFQYVLQTAMQKSFDVYETAMGSTPAALPDPALVIAADTVIVTVAGKILEKPRSEAEHVGMLRMLRDQKVHKVYTAVSVMAPRADARHPGYNSESTVEETRVFFSAETTDELIAAYVRTREGVDKAGGYALQGLGSLLVDRIEGSWDTVVGLPVRATLGLVEKVVLKGDEIEEEDEDDEELHD